ncbi:MAG: glycosyltransferase family 39 protein [Anaerolineales bacterium]
MRYPAPFVDEAWVGARAWNFLVRGQAFGALDYGVIDQFEGYWTFFPWLPTVFFSWGMHWFAQPSLLGMRLVALASGLLLLSAVYLIAKSVGGVRLGKLSILIVAFSLPFVYSSHLGRIDIFTATLGFWGIAIYMVNKSKRIWMSLLSGLLIGIAFETHAHGAIYIPVILALYFFDFRWTMFTKRHFWSMLMGLSMGLLFYLGLHVLPYPEGFLAFNRVVYSPTHTPPVLTFDFAIILDGIVDLLRLLVDTHFLTLLFIPLLFLDLAYSDNREHRQILVIVSFLAVAHALLIRNKHFYYAILVSPIIDIALAIFILRVFDKSLKKRGVFIIGRAFVFAIVIFSLSLNLRLFATNRSKNYDQVRGKLSQLILPDDTLMGSQTYWFSFYENTYLSWENLIYYQRKFEGSDIEDAFRAFRPDILILDQHWDKFFSDEITEDIYYQSLRLSRSEFDHFLTDMNAVLLTTIDDEQYGPILLYRLRWEA